MHLAKFQSIAATVLFLVSIQPAFAGDELRPFWLTNQPALSNGRTVLDAVRSGDTHSRTNVRALIGSPVIFVGGVATGGDANLMIWSNIVLEVEIRPARDVRPQATAWSAEVLGILTKVDFEKRVIHIHARPEDWKVRDTL